MTDDKKKWLERRAADYSAKYNDLAWSDKTEDQRIAEHDRYSCDGCDQNVQALKSAYTNGARELAREMLRALRVDVERAKDERFTDLEQLYHRVLGELEGRVKELCGEVEK